MNGRPTMSNTDLYKNLGLLKLTSIYRYNLFKFLRLLLDGKLPEFWNMLLSEHLMNHAYNTRQPRFRHPALTCEIERRALPHQLVLLYESVPKEILEKSNASALGIFKKSLIQNQ